MARGKKPRSDDEVGVDRAEAELLRKKKRRRKKPKHDHQAVVGGKKKRNSEKTKKCDHPKRRNHHEADAAGSSGSSKERRRRTRKKVVRWRLSQELVDYIRTREVMGFLAAEMPRRLRPNVTADLFVHQQLREEIAVEFVENKEFDAYVLCQYRTKCYAEMQEEEVLTDGEEEKEEEDDRRRCSQETSSVAVKDQWFPADGINDGDMLELEEAMLKEWLEPGVNEIMGDGSRSTGIRLSSSRDTQ